jgi:DNA polymerase-3 subunit delta'
MDKEGNVDRLDGLLRVEQATEIVRNAALRPLEGAHRIFLIQDAHTANDNFANRLLKTLEEPPPHVILCLTATGRGDLLPTIVSRCQCLELRPLRADVIRAALESKWGVAPQQAELLARLAGGRLGWAVRQLADATVLQQRTERLETLWRLAAAGRIERLAFAEQLAAGRTSDEIFGLLDLWTGWWRDIMLIQSGCADACSNVDHVARMQQHAQVVHPSEVRRYLYTLQRLTTYLHHTVNTRLALEVLLLRLPSLSAATGGAAL